jgi:ABC-type uncharacterized transport system substrate-binding protein
VDAICASIFVSLAETLTGCVVRPDVIVVCSAVATRAVQEQMRTIPIVFVYAGDPIASGIVTNISRPEGNTTSVNTDPILTIGGKWLELFKEAIPRLARVTHFRPRFPQWPAELLSQHNRGGCGPIQREGTENRRPQ